MTNSSLTELTKLTKPGVDVTSRWQTLTPERRATKSETRRELGVKTKNKKKEKGMEGGEENGTRERSGAERVV